jgi:hypothetical protein
MSSYSIHDAVLCAERRGRTPARSIDAALLVRLYSRNYDYLIINAVFFKALPFSQGSLLNPAVDFYRGAKEKFRYSRSLPSFGAEQQHRRRPRFRPKQSGGSA